MTEPALTRRTFITRASSATATVAAFGATAIAQQQSKPNQQNTVDLSNIHAPTEDTEKTPGPFLPSDKRIGFAIVGLGRLSLDQILPAFATSKYAHPTALVSGHRDKALKVAAQYSVSESSITDYINFEKLAQMPHVDAIYIVLPNGMHREFVERSARIGKHILCEKPMANSSADCEAMIAACARANIKLMIAYRQQYEPMNRALGKLITDGKLGQLRSILASNSKNQGDPAQRRLNRKLAGGGALPDVGIYCLNAARFLTNEEPEEVSAFVVQPKNDPRFREVEARCDFIARFPSGITATCSTAYDIHRSTFLRLEGSAGWAELDPAFGYHGNRMRWATEMDGTQTILQPDIPDKDPFALEMDHFSLCIRNNIQPHTPGEEGLQDQRIIEAIYRSANTGKAVRLAPPKTPTRGPALSPVPGSS